jgi:hypothetical protein
MDKHNIINLLNNIEIIYQRKEVINNIINPQIPLKPLNNELLYKQVKLKYLELPVLPFIWYREKETMCPLKNLGIIKKTQVKDIYNYDVPNDIFLIEQTHICTNYNLYISIHSLMYYMMHTDQFKNKNVVKIPGSENVQKTFQVTIISLLNSNIIELPNGLKKDIQVSGSVYTHNESFSPPGTLHFKVDNTLDQNVFICIIKNDELKIDMTCLYILKNDFKPAFCL